MRCYYVILTADPSCVLIRNFILKFILLCVVSFWLRVLQTKRERIRSYVLLLFVVSLLLLVRLMKML